MLGTDIDYTLHKLLPVYFFQNGTYLVEIKYLLKDLRGGM